MGVYCVRSRVGVCGVYCVRSGVGVCGVYCVRSGVGVCGGVLCEEWSWSVWGCTV